MAEPCPETEGLLHSGSDEVHVDLSMIGREMTDESIRNPCRSLEARRWFQPGVANRRQLFRTGAIATLAGVAVVAVVAGLAPTKPQAAVSQSARHAVAQKASELQPRQENRAIVLGNEGAATTPMPVATTTKAKPTTTVQEGHVLNTFVVGQEIEGSRAGAMVRGRVFSDFGNGSYQIVWRDGKTIEPIKGVKDLREAYDAGDNVYAEREGTGWTKGTVVTVNGDGTYQVDWFDGDNVDTIQQGNKLVMAFDVGQAVDCTRGGITGNRGQIVKDKGDGFFEVKWQDGSTRETLKSGDYMRRAVAVGQEVEGNRSRVPVTPGTIIIYSGFGNYSVKWNDNKTEESSQKPGIHLVPRLSAGMQVEAKRSDGTWKPAIINVDNGGDLFTVIWDDGSKTDTVRNGTDLRKAFFVGEPVKGYHNGKINMRGLVTKVRGAGLYDVLFVDHTTAHEEVTAGHDTKHADFMYSSHDVGDKVKAPRGGVFYFDATVLEDRRDGTYLVSWDDGGKDDTIKKGGELRRVEKVLKLQKATVPLPVFMTGMAVYAHFWGPRGDVKGNPGEWVPAFVLYENTNSTYHIMYADGRTVELNKYDYELRKMFQVGDKVYGIRNGVWKKGIITVDNKDGSYTVQWEDGANTETIKSSTELVVAMEVGSAALGMRGNVAGNYAKVVNDNQNGTYLVEWKDGVLIELVRRGDALRPVAFIGQQIEGTRGGIPVVRGKVVGTVAGGKYTILWKDGQKIEVVKSGLDIRQAFTVGMYVKVLRGAVQGKDCGEWSVGMITRPSTGKIYVAWLDGAKLGQTQPDLEVQRVFFKGQDVAGVRGGKTEVRGKVLADLRDGTYWILWADGSKKDYIQDGNSLHRAFSIGDEVYGPRGWDMFFNGTISKDFKDGTYMVDWVDGNLNGRVKKGGELRKGGEGKPIGWKFFLVGQKVEGLFWGAQGEAEGNNGTWKKGEIVSDNGDGIYGIAWEDGSKTENIKGSYALRPLFFVDDKVIDKEGTRGVVKKYKGDGTYDVEFEGKGVMTKTYAHIVWYFVVGERVRGVRGIDQMKLGVIKKDNKDGTYDVNWDDGSKDEKTQHSFMLWRVGMVFWAGETVEAFREGSKLNRGKVTEKWRNKFYPIEWDDGKKVPKDMLSSSLYRVFFVGEAVEAKRRAKPGLFRWSRAVIREDLKNRSYKIEWKDGEKSDTMQLCDDIRRAYDAGDAVQAGFKTVSKGKVTKDNKDGTYVVDWEGGKQGELRSCHSMSKGVPEIAARTEAPSTEAPSTEAPTTEAPTTAAAPTTMGLRYLGGDHQIAAEYDLTLVKWYVKAGDKVNTSSKLCRVRKASILGRRLAEEKDIKCSYNGTVFATLDAREGERVRKGEHLVAVNDLQAGFPWWILLLILLCCLMCCLIICLMFCCRDDEKKQEEPEPTPAPPPKVEDPPPAEPTPAPPPPPVQEPANPVVPAPPPPTPPAAPDGTRFDFKYPNGEIVTKYLKYHPLGAQMARTHNKTHVEKLHFASYAESLGVPLQSQVVRIDNEKIPDTMDHFTVARKILDALRKYPVWPLEVTFDTGSGERLFKFTKNKMGIKFTRHTPISVETVEKGEQAMEFGVQKHWKIVKIHNIDTKTHKFAEVNSKLHDGLHHLDPAHHDNPKHKHHC